MLRQSPGFTLFEMLVVVLVIGLLALLVMGLRRPHRERGRDRCNSNLGSLIKCCHLYSDSVPNLGRFPQFNGNHNGDGDKALAMLYDAYVKDDRIYSCPYKPTDTSVLKRYVAPFGTTLQTGFTNYGYDPGHTPTHATAGVVGDRGVLHASNRGNSTNHGPDAPGQYVAVGAGSVEWWDNAYARPVQDKLGNATTDNIFADDIKLPDFPEDLETNIIN